MSSTGAGGRSARRFDGKIGLWFILLIVAINALLVGAIVVAALRPDLTHGVPEGYEVLFTTIFMMLPLVGCDVLMVPMVLKSHNYVEVDDEQVRVVCGLFPRSIALAQIEGVAESNMWRPKANLRSATGATGGKSAFPRMTLGMGLAAHGVSIESKDAVIYCSPEEPKALIREIERRRRQQ